MVVTGPAVFLTPQQAARHRLPGGSLASCVCDVGREQLMAALDDSFSFPAFLQQYGRAYTDADGVFTVSSLEELYDWQPVLQRQQIDVYKRQRWQRRTGSAWAWCAGSAPPRR